MLRRFPVICLGVMLVTTDTRAGVLLDASFFSDIPHSLIDFETDGAGDPVILGSGLSRLMPTDEYASQGIVFAPAVLWVNDLDDEFDAAQAIGGSLDVAILVPADSFEINFLFPTRAFGFWVLDNNTEPTSPVFEAFDADGELIETAMFEGPAVDGTIGIADYGFLGIVADVEIASVRITKDAASLDDLRFSAVPEPTSLVLVAASVTVLLRRRQSQAGWLARVGRGTGGCHNHVSHRDRRHCRAQESPPLRPW